MKKKPISVVLLTAVAGVMLCGCGDKNETETNSSAEKNVAEATTIETNITEAVTTEVISEELTETELKFNQIAIGDVIELDHLKLTVDSVEKKDKYEFSYTEKTKVGTSTKNCSIEPASGMKLVCVRGKITNKYSTEQYMTNDFVVYGKMYIDGNEYSMKMDCVDSEKAERFMGIKPQQTEEYYYYAEVPANVVDSMTSCEVKIGFVNNFEAKYVGGFEDLDNVYSLEVTPK